MPNLLLVYAAFALAVGSPGPSTLAIMAASMERGRGAGVTLALGVTAGSFTWGLLATAGVSTLLAAHEGALYFIKISGGLYLFFLAWKSARSALRPDGVRAAFQHVGPQDRTRTFVRGYLMHLTNPKAILGWIAIMAIGLRPDAPSAILLAMLFGCLGISMFFNCGYALLFSTEPMVRGYRKVRRWVEGCLAGIFVFAGFKLLTSKP
ncbi:MAG: LysE family translocator [Hyphomicrobiaceae bacterium]|nr:LysE family translocator [Hyphomicrobiaceae bacterium]